MRIIGLKLTGFYALLTALLISAMVQAADEPGYRSIDGVGFYLGVVPGQMIQGHDPEHSEAEMHGGVPRGRHVHHIMVAIFDEASGERVENASIEARVTPLGLATVTRPLEPMRIADALSFGNYFTLCGNGPYEIEIAITTAESTEPLKVEFTYEHQTR